MTSGYTVERSAHAPLACPSVSVSPSAVGTEDSIITLCATFNVFHLKCSSQIPVIPLCTPWYSLEPRWGLRQSLLI